MPVVFTSICHSETRSQNNLRTSLKLKKYFILLLPIKIIVIVNLIANQTKHKDVYPRKTFLICIKENFKIKYLLYLLLGSIPLLSKRKTKLR